MINLITEYPYIDSKGREHRNLVRHYAKDENGNLYQIQQLQTMAVYDQAIDVYPCKYIYLTTDKMIEKEEV